MARNASEMERAVARTLRDSLETLQRNRDDVDQAVADLVSACSSARPGNTLPPLLRAQTAAAGLGATLNVLARFLTMAMQPGWSSPLAESETEIECEGSVAPAVNQPQVAVSPAAAIVPAPVPAPAPVAAPPPVSARVAPPVVEEVQAQTPAVAPASVLVPAPVLVPVIEFPSVSSAIELEPEVEPGPAALEEALRSVAVESAPEPAPASRETIPVVAAIAASAAISEAAALAPELPAFEIPQAEAAPPDPADLRSALELLEPIEEPVASQSSLAVAVAAAAPMQPANAAVAAAPPVIERPVFDVAALPADQQELHRRANRVAKVSMQDIKMLRPTDVVAGKESHDICVRLRDDIERAHKEYERRFHAILDHPVDYFYVWMVEILGEGDPRVLGNYPYSSPMARQ